MRASVHACILRRSGTLLVGAHGSNITVGQCGTSVSDFLTDT